MQPSRRTTIVDTAITLLGVEGGRGLTHRAVDAAAGVPQGSTSYYFRTRSSLLVAIVERLVELDVADAPELTTDRADRLAEELASWVGRVLSSGRERQLARYELVLESTRRPELRDELDRARAHLLTLIAHQLGGLAVPRPQECASRILTLVDGVVLAAVVRADGDDAPPAALAAWILATVELRD